MECVGCRGNLGYTKSVEMKMLGEGLIIECPLCGYKTKIVIEPNGIVKTFDRYVEEQDEIRRKEEEEKNKNFPFPIEKKKNFPFPIEKKKKKNK